MLARVFSYAVRRTRSFFLANALLRIFPAQSSLYVYLRYFIDRDRSADLFVNQFLSRNVMRIGYEKSIAIPILDALASGEISLEQIRSFMADVLRFSDKYANIDLRIFEFIYRFLDRDFTGAYKAWLSLESTRVSFHLFPSVIDGTNQAGANMALVLPGLAEEDYGALIDSYAVVARTGLSYPAESDAPRIGVRYDIAFLNYEKYQSYLASSRCDLPWVITKKISSKSGLPACDSRVDFFLESPRTSYSAYTYFTNDICDWCFAGSTYKPVLFNGDFYLGGRAYQDASYCSRMASADVDGIIKSYFVHDVFFSHAHLSHLYHVGLVEAHGNIERLLKMSGEDFAAVLQHTWGRVSS